jgi:hypothetical protein
VTVTRPGQGLIFRIFPELAAHSHGTENGITPAPYTTRKPRRPGEVNLVTDGPYLKDTRGRRKASGRASFQVFRSK